MPVPRSVPASSAPSRMIPRVRAAERTLLSPKAPTVTLNRLQSGIGALTFEARVSEAVGDLRLGCAYELTGGRNSVLLPADANRPADTGRRSSGHPVLVSRHDHYDRVVVDLRQSREFERAIVFGFSESARALRWGGTLIVTALGAARVELPLDLPASAGVSVFMSLFNVKGEFVLRAEMETVKGSVRDACTAYGFDRISWLDDRTPVG